MSELGPTPSGLKRLKDKEIQVFATDMRKVGRIEIVVSLLFVAAGIMMLVFSQNSWLQEASSTSTFIVRMLPLLILIQGILRLLVGATTHTAAYHLDEIARSRVSDLAAQNATVKTQSADFLQKTLIALRVFFYGLAILVNLCFALLSLW